MDNGWIKIHRSMLEWEWYSDLPCRVLFMHLLLKANYKKTRFQGHEIPKGSAVVGLNSLSEDTGLTKQQIRTALKKLKNTQEINTQTTSKFTIVSILKWEDYQESNTQTTQEQHTCNTRATTSKEGNNTTTVIGEKIYAIAGMDQNPNYFGENWRIDSWLASGWDVEMDILPTIKRLMSKKDTPPSTIKYFETAIADAHASRLAPVPKGKAYGTTRKPSGKFTVQDAIAQANRELGIEP